MKKKIKVNGKEYVIREMLNSEFQSLPRVVETMSPEEKDKVGKDAVKKETIMCANITSEEYDKLTYKEYLTLRQAILQINTPEADFWVAS